ncbi:RidA family protein [Tetragenococcus halophilus]|uniref:RidA family protein n=1 Tax=Tetragenococcus halophilus TaxID=51669 RepID=UPI000CC56FFB|nr:RidA family protein [Tetragenococcus halophilus]QXN87424.1 RidA family protein [Tetragenococcus halophilus]RQD33302.1 RidA family protein [Tetragenococcus halophilus subsp. halophilus DSM 20339]WJS82588.1 RidA family protein [Tetragenococcus halophilus]GBD58916.1 hypothetical protein TEHN0098T_0912 [Tetragenococcus halophilus subsp. halophilus]GBD62491.1 hypothetical protein TEH11_2174 [Tetragenococcus halophilus subsp. halophilus]
MPIYTNSLVSNAPFLFISGQTPEENNNIPDSIQDQTHIVLQKINSLIAEHNLDLTNLVKVNVYITDASYLPDVRSVVTEIFGEIKPAVTLVVVAGLINEQFKIEIDATASFAKVE